MHWFPRAASLLCLTLAVGCSKESLELIVDLRTDYQPGEEFGEVEVLLESLGTGVQRFRRDPWEPGVDYVAGARVAEWSGLEAGDYRATLRLWDGRGVRAERPILVTLHERLVVTGVITRNCEDVVCPGAGPAERTACLDGRCVDPRCVPERPSACEEPSCGADAECAPAVACQVGRCIAGSCLYPSPDGACPDGEWCNPFLGCEPVSPPAEADGSVPPDAGTTDAATDASTGDAGGKLPDDVEPGTVAQYDFDDGESYGADSAGAHPATLEGAPTPVPGQGGAGNALSFGSIDDHLVVPHAAAFELDEGSIDFWVYLEQFPPSPPEGLVTKDAFGIGMGHFGSWVDANGLIRIRFQTDAVERFLAADDAVPIGVWTHVGINFGPGGLELYVGGVLRASDAGWTTGIAGNDNPWVFGASSGGSDEGTASPLGGSFESGALDRIRISSVRRDFTR